MWAERYDGNITEYFAVQDTFVRKIVGALALNLSKSEQDEIASGQTSNLKAREAFQKGWELYQQYTPKDNAEAAKHLDDLLNLLIKRTERFVENIKQAKRVALGVEDGDEDAE